MASLNLDFEVEQFNAYYYNNISMLERAAEYYRSLVNSLISDACYIQSVTYRVKDRDECINKFKRKYLTDLEKNENQYEIKDHITDIIGLRIVCLYETEIETIKNILTNNFDVIDITDKIKNLDSTDDKFGYKSLHIDLRLNDERKRLPEYAKFTNLRFEVQIRTVIQDAWSVLDHKIKYKKSIPFELKRRINRLSALFEIADDEFFNIKCDTDDFEKKAQADSKPDEPLNVVTFLSVAEQVFPTYQFISERADSFVHEILVLSENFTKVALLSTLSTNMAIVREYSREVFNKNYIRLNPYTEIRHCLYLLDRNTFQQLLFNTQRESFDEWMDSKSTR